MSSSGLLTIRARHLAGALSDIAVELKRPPVTRLFLNQNPDAVVKMVPYIYTLCAHAQRAAARAALAAADGLATPPVDAPELWLELLHENLWRLLLDWPPALGLPPAKEAFAAWRTERLGENLLPATRLLLDKTFAKLTKQCCEKLAEPAHHDYAVPSLNPDAWLAYWQGTVAEAPKYAVPTSIVGAFHARLGEVEAAWAALSAGSPYPVAAAGGEGWGVGQTITARGVLTHAVRIFEGKVINYRVWAPTDCHFADAAPLAALLEGKPVGDFYAARRLIDQAVLALDPCLPYVVELQDA
jgi:uptake hydrogenase large subunit